MDAPRRNPRPEGGAATEERMKITKWIKLKSQLLLEDFVLKKSASRIYSIIGGPIFFQTVRSAIELDFFDVLQRAPGFTARMPRHMAA